MKNDWVQEIISMMKEYDNFYTDISYFVLRKHKNELKKAIEEYPHIKERILFGTDWYLTELDNLYYDKYCIKSKEILDEIDKDLWERFTFSNPFKFYGLNNLQKVENIRNGLITKIDEAYKNDQLKDIEKNDKIKELEKGYNIIKRLIKKIEK